MKLLKKLRSSLAFNVIGAVVMLLVLFSWIVSIIGYISFTKAFKDEYSETTFHMARTAATLVNGDNIDRYLQEGVDGEYEQTERYLDIYCERMSVSLIYVIRVDESDYGRFWSVFNCIDNSVDNTNYTKWELGYERDATNEDYTEAYKQLYGGETDHTTMFRTRKLNGAHPHITTMTPIKNSKGDVVALMCIQRPMRELRESRRPYLLIIAASTIMLSVFVSFVAAALIRKNLLNPINRVIDEAHRFAEENTLGEKLGSNEIIIEEIADLATSIDTMEDKMVKYVEHIKSITAEREKIGVELNIASVIQQNSIPNDFPAFPERSDFDIFASMTPAKEVGGDFYNFFLLDDDHLVVIIGDVSGKGVPAALFMMICNILVSQATRLGGSPAEVFTEVNNRICEHNKADMFVTLWLGVIELSTGRVIAANAGHDDPVIYRENGGFELFTNKHSIVIGAMPGIVYKDVEFRLNKGDKLFVYTDGIPEANDKDNNMFTMNRMLDSLNKFKNESPEGVIKGVKACVDEFVADAPQFDDLTMLCFELKDITNKTVKNLTVDATDESFPVVADFVESFLEEHGCSPKTQMQINLAVEEIYVNIAHYAYKDKTGKACVDIDIDDNRVVTIVFRDSGSPYNPLAKPDPDTTLSAEQRQIGGLGIFLVKKEMDSVNYEYENGFNIFTMKKTI